MFFPRLRKRSLRFSTPDRKRVTAAKFLHPHLETLEDRLSPAAHTWSPTAVSGLWSNAANWSVGGAPTPGETNVSLTFGSSTQTALTDDLGGTPITITSINFSTSTTYTITLDTPVYLAGTINSSAATGANTIADSTIAPAITLMGTSTFNQAAGGVLSITASIGGAAANSLSVNGASGTGTVVLSNSNNNFYGATTIAGGTLQATANNALGSSLSGNTTVGSGATLDLPNVNYSSPRPLTLQGGTLLVSSGNSTFAGAISPASAGSPDNVVVDGASLTLSGSAPLLDGTLNVGGPGDTLITGTIYGGNINVVGPGVVTDSASISGGNPTTVAGGTFVFNGFIGYAVNESSGATVSGTGTAEALDINGNLYPGINGVGTLTNTGQMLFSLSGGPSSFTAKLNGALDSSNDLAVTATTAEVGLEDVNLNVTQSTPTTAGEVFTIISGSAEVEGQFNNLPNNATFVNAGRVYRINYNTYTVTLTDVTPVLHWVGSGAANGNLWNVAANWLEDAVPVSGDTLDFDTTTGGFSATSNGFAPVNNISGLTNMTLIINDASSAGDFDLTGDAIGLRSGGVTSTVTAGANATVAMNLNVPANTTFTANAGSTLIISGVLSGSGNLLANGAGTVTLSGSSGTGYTGTTTVSAGTVVVNGANTASPVAVSGGTLAGAGTVENINASGGTISPGGNGVVGVLSTAFSSSSLSGSTLMVDVSSSDVSDQLVMGAGETVNLTGAALSVNVLNSVNGNVYTIVSSSTGGISGVFTGLANNATFLSDGHTFQIAYASTSVTLTDVSPALGISPGAFAGGDVGALFNHIISVTGGIAPYTALTVTSYNGGGTGVTAPTVNLAAGTATFNSTPSATGTVTFTVQAVDSAGSSLTQNYDVVISPVLTLAPAALPIGEAGLLYNAAIAVGNGTTPYTSVTVTNYYTGGTGMAAPAVSATAGSVDFDSTPTASGVATFNVSVVDSAGAGVTANYSVAIQPTLSFVPDVLPPGDEGVAYNQAIQVENGVAPYTGLVVLGFQASGTGLSSANVTANPAAGTVTINGIPGGIGSVSFTAEVTDSLGATLTQNFTLAINSTPSVTTTTLANGTNYIPYSQAIVVSGGSAPLDFTLVAGSLPQGLSLNSSTGVISGIPTAAAGLYSFTIAAADAASSAVNQDYTVSIANPVEAITTETLPNWTATEPYDQTIGVFGGTAPISFAVSSGNLPTGLSLNSSTGAITGTPAATSGSPFSFTITATDANEVTASQVYNLVINPAPAMVTSTLPSWAVDQPYNQTVEATGGTGSLTFSVAAGNLPAGLTLNSATGVIAGTPTSYSPVTFTITVTDAVNASASQAYALYALPSITTAGLPNWTINRPYNHVISEIGGSQPVQFTLSGGSLPPGLSLSSSTGAITGTPTSLNGSPFSFTITATDALGESAAQNFSVAINSAPLIRTPALPPNWDATVPYSQNIVATSGSSPLTFAVSSGTLPAGLSLNGATGALTGTPTTSASYSFTISVTDAAGATNSRAFSVFINQALGINTPYLGPWTINQSYSASVTYGGGTAPLTPLVTAGSLPPGLTFDNTSITDTAEVSGVPTSTSGSPYSFTVTITDAIGATQSRTYSFVVNPPPTIITTVLPNWTVNKPYYQSLNVSGGTPSYHYMVAAGSLPPGLTLSSYGTITGTPTTTSGSPFTFDINVYDAAGGSGTQAYSLTINSPPTITTTSLPSSTVNRPYNHSIATSNGTAPFSFVVSAGSLPPGLSLGSVTGSITGTPSSSSGSPFSFTITATDAAGATASHAYTVTINAAPSIITTTLPNWTINRSYSQTIATTGGTTPLTFAASAGSLPTGLILHSSTGVISGTPTSTSGSPFSFTITVTDAAGATASQGYTIAINSTPVIATTTLPSGDVNQPFNQTLVVAGGTAPVSFGVIAGLLPPGLSINSSTGTISGTPTTTTGSPFSFSVSIIDASGASASQSYTVFIFNPAVPTITTTALPNWTINQPYNQTIGVVGGAFPISFAVSAGNLPTGLNLNSGTGTITGTPTTPSGSPFNFTITATDADNATASQAYTVIINPALSLTATGLPNWTVNQPYSQTIGVTGGTAPITCTVSAGSLPTGLSLNSSTGAISGTPTPTTGSPFSFTVTATDAASATTSQAYTVAINPAPAITTTMLPNWTVNQPYSQTIAETGGTSPFSFTVSAGSLPPGLSLNSSTGAITGMPTTTSGSPFSFTITGTDAASATTNQAYMITINPALGINPTTLPAASSGSAYNQNINITGGTTPYTTFIVTGFNGGTTGLTSAAVATNATAGAVTVNGTPTSGGTATFTVNVTDSAGATLNQNYTLTVNEAPTFTSANNATFTTGTADSFTVTANGFPATFTYTETGTLPTGVTLSTGGVLSGTPTQTGTFPITITANNGITPNATQNFTLTVTSPTFQVTSTTLLSGGAGFLVTFNAGYNISQLSLYDGDSGNTLTTRGVLITGPNGAIFGGSAPDTMRFNAVPVDSTDLELILTGLNHVAPAKVLAAGTYTVTLDGGTSDPAFRRLSDGAFLDGNGDGTIQAVDNYTTILTVTAIPASTDVVSIGDQVAGPGQTLPVPLVLSGGSGSVSDTTSVSLTIASPADGAYTVTGFTVNSAISGATANFNAATGQLTISWSWPFSTNDSPLLLGTFTFAVAGLGNGGTAPSIDTKTPIDINVTSVLDATSNSKPFIGVNGFHVSAYLGNLVAPIGIYNSSDVSQVQGLIITSVRALALYPNVDPLLLADVNNNGSVNSADVSQLQARILGLPSSLPVLPLGSSSIAVNGADPVLFVGSTSPPNGQPANLGNLTPGSTVLAPLSVFVTDPRGVNVTAAEAAFSFDPKVFTINGVSAGAIANGSLGGRSFAINYSVVAPGELEVIGGSSFGPNLAYGQTATLFLVSLTVRADAPAGGTVFNLMSSEAGLRTGLQDNLGRNLVLAPAPSNSAGDNLDGVFTVQSGKAVQQTAGGQVGTANSGVKAGSVTALTPGAWEQLTTQLFGAAGNQPVLNAGNGPLAVALAVTDTTESKKKLGSDPLSTWEQLTAQLFQAANKERILNGNHTTL